MNIDELIEQLDQANVYKRAEAVQLLELSRDSRVVDTLIKVLTNDPDAYVRSLAVSALGTLGDKRALEVLRGLLDKREEITASAIGALGKLRDIDVAPKLLTLLYDPDHAIRSAAISALCELRYPPALAHFRTLIRDSNPVTRYEATLSLFSLGRALGDDIQADLEMLLSDPVEHIRKETQLMLQLIRHGSGNNEV